MLMLLLVVTSLVCHVTVNGAPYNCPARCRCDGEHVTSCNIDTLAQLSTIEAKSRIDELSVSSCNQNDVTAHAQRAFSKLICKRLVLSSNGVEYEKCEYTPTDTPINTCVHLCTKNDENAMETCMCFKCNPHHSSGAVRVRRSAHGNATNDSNNNNVTAASPGCPQPRFQLHFIIILGAVSLLAFLVNFVVMVKLCCSPLTVIDLFGTALMLFNVMLSTYGISMTFYLFRPSLLANPIYCRFFVSIKLFSLGSGLYTMCFLIFHRPIAHSSDDGHDRGEIEEGKKKAVKKDAIFKGIVFLLEAVMLAGVLGVLSWIPLFPSAKTTEPKCWKPLCVIITPEGSIEGLFHGIECWYYVLSGLLVFFYVGNYINSKVTKFRQYRENLKKIKAGEEDEGLLGSDDKPESPPYIVKDFPLFVLVTSSFCIWIGGFVLTLPQYSVFTSKGGPEVVRICSVMIPLILQPIIYVIRNTCCFQCPCLMDPRNRAGTTEEKLELEKCTSDDVTSQSNNNLHVVTTRFDSMPPTTPPIATAEEDLTDKNENTKLMGKKPKTRVNDFEIPKVVCRSPNLSGERTALLDDMDGKKTPTPTPTIVIVDEVEAEAPVAPTATETAGLLNGENDTDANGRVSRGPTFYPIAEKEGDGLTKHSDNKPPTPIEEEVEGILFANNAKTKKGSKKGGKKSNSVSSSGSGDSYARSDSSTSHDSTAAVAEPTDDLDSVPTPGTEHTEPPSSELTRLKNQINKPTLNNNNNNNNISYDDVISGENESLLNSSDDVINDHDVIGKVNSKGNEGTADSNHTSTRLKKPLLTRDNSGSVER